MENPAIAALFDEMADLLELDGAVVFRVRAYRNAARTVRDLGTPLRELAQQHPGQLTELPGIGKDLAARIQELVATGDFHAHRELLAKFPESLLQLLRLPNLGPKRVKQLYDELHISSVAELRQAIAQGRLADVRGFGERSAAKLKEELDKAIAERRFLLADAEQWADAVVSHLRGAPHVKALDVAGSLRRRRETIGDLDVLIVTGDPADAVRRFVEQPDTETVLARGDTKASVRLRGGPQVDLRVVAPAEYGAALLYFTGSKAHNIELRKIAQAMGLKLSEYGVFREEERVAGATEQEVYATLGLDWIPPELREARGEIARARDHALPALVTRDDIRGELHAHTDATDGKASLEEMVRRLDDRRQATTERVQQEQQALNRMMQELTLDVTL